jgi:thiamine-phosphate pyrophosphorylase
MQTRRLRCGPKGQPTPAQANRPGLPAPASKQKPQRGALIKHIDPTFPSQTKNFESFPGLDFVRAVATEIALPAFAIGGITLENLPQVISAGLRRVAVSGSIVSASNPTAATKDFLARLDS